ncbi:MAG: hypothetical protein N3G22_03030 [Candidatus Micrarchaeota archaeon]|nr:hypothetical protein [Candidatus Micrarchaeota archaeon]
MEKMPKNAANSAGRILFAILALCSLSAAAPCDPTGDRYLDVCGIDAFNCSSGGALDWIALAFMFVSLAIALTYMYGKLRQDPPAETWAKDEAINLGLSVLLFAGLLVFFTGSCEIAKSYSGENPLGASKKYLNTLLKLQGEGVIKGLAASSLSNQMGATWYLYVGIAPFKGGGVAGRANQRALSTQKEMLIDFYLPMVASLTAQLYLLQVIEWVGASILLPFAFVLRLIPPTREFGNVLLAMFFAIYIVVPTLYAMSGKIFLGMIEPDAPTECVTGGCYAYLFYSYGLDPSDPSGLPYKTFYFYKIGSTLPQAIFLPNLAIVIGISTISALSKALRAIEV